MFLCVSCFPWKLFPSLPIPSKIFRFSEEFLLKQPFLELTPPLEEVSAHSPQVYFLWDIELILLIYFLCYKALECKLEGTDKVREIINGI